MSALIHIYHLCKRHFLPLIVLVVLLVCSISARAQTSTEYQVKAVFIYNFVNFIEWPETAFKQSSDPFVIGIVGPNVFGSTLSEVVKGETYRGRPIFVRVLDNVEAVNACHIVYIEKSFPNPEQVVSNTSDYPVLTVSDTDDFLRNGGIIRLFLEQNKVRIEINQQRAANRQLTISSKLLKLAKLYQD